MRANEFRLGNLVYYHIVDSMDECKEYDEISPIDYDDIRCFVQYEDNSEYKPIPLTEEWLLKFGFMLCPVCKDFDWLKMPYYAKEGVLLFFNEHRTKYELSDYYIGFGEMRGGEYSAVAFKWIKYVHQLQNLYFALTEKELEIKP